MLASIIITVKNEERTITQLLDRLLQQQKPYEIIIVDSQSTDQTQKKIKKYQQKHPEIKLYTKKSTRGEGRNYGASKAQGEILAFTDGGCKPNKKWLQSLKNKIQQGYDIAAGKTIDTGYFKNVKRVKIKINKYDITYPSCNLAYKKQLFQKINGFDTRFITAEDIDLNLRTVQNGAKIGDTDQAIICRKSAPNILKLIKQAFWYGYGRKQLTLKHGRLWKKYSPQQTFQTHLDLKGLIRLFFGLLGYLTCKTTGGKIR
ncbi:MAG: glycosyltransferase [Petrotogales bacterium]